MEPIKLKELKINQILNYYSPQEEKWAQVRIIDLGLNYVALIGMEGELKGISWKENISNLKNLALYRTYEPPIPEPPPLPKKKVKTKVWVYTMLIIIIALQVVTLIKL